MRRPHLESTERHGEPPRPSPSLDGQGTEPVQTPLGRVESVGTSQDTSTDAIASQEPTSWQKPPAGGRGEIPGWLGGDAVIVATEVRRKRVNDELARQCLVSRINRAWAMAPNMRLGDLVGSADRLGPVAHAGEPPYDGWEDDDALVRVIEWRAGVLPVDRGSPKLVLTAFRLTDEDLAILDEVGISTGIRNRADCLRYVLRYWWRSEGAER